MVKRKIIQAAATVIQNGNLSGFASGSLYRGPLKQICVPSLNCHSCPGALGACPIGSMQALAISPNFGLSFYVYGTLVLIGVLFGRLICGFICPFGLIQELLHKIPLKKIGQTPVFRVLRKLKYLILVVLVIGLPTAIMLTGGIGFPAFCQFVCPAGTLGAGVPMAISNARIQSALGLLFVWKGVILAVVLVAAVKIFRPFCKFVCPLGAIYALLNKISVVHIMTDSELCNGCGGCMSICKMHASGTDDFECIRCGECVSYCPNNAKKWSIKTRNAAQKVYGKRSKV